MAIAASANPDALHAEIDRLVIERQRLRVHGAPAARLERNRAAIVRAQWQFSEALIARYAPAAVRRAA